MHRRNVKAFIGACFYEFYFPQNRILNPCFSKCKKITEFLIRGIFFNNQSLLINSSMSPVLISTDTFSSALETSSIYSGDDSKLPPPTDK